jgi:hypothetical protein
MCKIVNFGEAAKVIADNRESQGRGLSWAGLSQEDVKRQGAELLAMLYQRANEDGLQLKELAAVLGVTYGYIHQLKTGLREVAQVSDEFVASCAKYLNKPRIYIQALAGKLSLADFSEQESLEGEVDSALSLMYKDRNWGGFMSLSIKSLGLKERLLIIRLYESATGKTLINKLDFEKLQEIAG